MEIDQRVETLTARVSRKGYGVYHILKLLDLLSIKGPLGRSLISRELSIGEGSSRSLVKCMRSLGFVETDPVGGSYLTAKGREFLARWRGIVTSSACVEERLNPSPWGLMSISFLHRSRSREILSKGILNIRDAIVREGCLGALIMSVRGGEVYMLDTAGKPDIDISRTPLGIKILSLCERGENTLIIAGASRNSCIDAERCVWEAVILLLGEGDMVEYLGC